LVLLSVSCITIPTLGGTAQPTAPAGGQAAAAPAGGRAAAAPPGEAVLNFSFPLQNPHNFLLYPAVGAAFIGLRDALGARTAELWNIDSLGNQFTIRNCVAARTPMDLISYQIRIAYQANQLTIEFINIQPIGSLIMQYSNAELDALSRFDTQGIAQEIKTSIEQTLASTSAYAAAKNAFLLDNAFLSRAFVPVTNAMLDEFAQSVFKNGKITLSASVLDVRRNENAEFANYSTMISAGLNARPGASAFAFVNLFTNNAELAQLRQGQQVALSGEVVRLERVVLNYRFIMTN